MLSKRDINYIKISIYKFICNSTTIGRKLSDSVTTGILAIGTVNKTALCILFFFGVQLAVYLLALTFCILKNKSKTSSSVILFLFVSH